MGRHFGCSAEFREITQLVCLKESSSPPSVCRRTVMPGNAGADSVALYDRGTRRISNFSVRDCGHVVPGIYAFQVRGIGLAVLKVLLHLDGALGFGSIVCVVHEGFPNNSPAAFLSGQFIAGFHVWL